jgi:hypothetical protein
MSAGYVIVSAETVAAARLHDPTEVRARFVDTQPALLRHAMKIGTQRNATDAALVAATISWAAFVGTYDSPASFPHLLPIDIELARPDAATARTRQPHLHAAVCEVLGTEDAALATEIDTLIVALDNKARTLPRPLPRWMPKAAHRFLLWFRQLTRPERDDAITIPRRLHFRTWMFAIGVFFSVYAFTFSVVHVTADMRECQLHLSDPLHDIVPLDLWWWNISITGYEIVTLFMVGLLLVQAYLGDHRAIVRFGVGLGVMGIFRACTILLVPLCRVGQTLGTARLHETPTLSIFGLFHIPWQMWASNDLLFSGHVAETILFLRVTRAWPKPVRLFLVAFTIAQIYALLATRGHYTVDLIVAIPVAYFADRMSVHFLTFLERHRAYRKLKQWLAARSA